MCIARVQPPWHGMVNPDSVLHPHQPRGVHMGVGARRRLSTAINNWISGESAYQVLGVSESSSFDEIKASFRKLAKETHPDVSHHSSHRFLQILAAYEVFILLLSL